MPTLRINDQQISCKGILFDKDGTLLHFMTLWGSWADAVLRRMSETLLLAGAEFTGPVHLVLGTEHGEGGEVLDYDRKGPLAMSSNEETITILAWQLYAAGIPWNEAVVQAAQICKNAMWDVRQQKPVHPMPGLFSFLSSCRASSVKLGVVTSDDTQAAAEQLAWAGLAEYFDVILGRDAVVQGKPYPELVEKAAVRLGLLPEELIVIGDTNGDMQMAKQAGARLAVGIAEDVEEARQVMMDADLLIKDYNELKMMKA